MSSVSPAGLQQYRECCTNCSSQTLSDSPTFQGHTDWSLRANGQNALFNQMPDFNRLGTYPAKGLVRPQGFEPWTPRLRVACSTN